jgi:RimJ/RimL family protein N-acetyltransferase
MILEPTKSVGDLTWLASRAGITVHAGLEAIKATDTAGRIVGMVGFDGWTPNALCMHIALEYPGALRRLIRPGFDIAFNRLQKRLVIVTVLSTNKRSLALVRHLGFIETHRILDGWDVGAHLVIHEMRRHECRWLETGSEVKNGRRRQVSTKSDRVLSAGG